MALTTDSFNRADSTSSLGTTDGSGTLDPLTWVQQQGTLGINSNQGYASALTSFLALATVETGQADIDASLKLVTTDGSALVFRFTDMGNRWIAHASASTVYLIKRVAGTGTIVYSTSGGGSNQVLRVVANGSSIQLFRNGVSLTTITDSDLSTATKHGFYVESTSSRVEDFSVSPLVTVVTGTATISPSVTVTATGTATVAGTATVTAAVTVDVLVVPPAWGPGDDWPGPLEGGAVSPKWGGYVRLWVRAAIAAGNSFHVGDHAYDNLDAGNVLSGAEPVGRTAIDRLWVDLTCDVLDVDIQGGASKGQGIFSKADAGTCTVTLLDPDGIYDPLNPIPPWQYQGRTRLLPGVPVEVFAEVIDDPSVDPATVTRYWLFTGTADSWGEDWTPSPYTRTATLVASDVTKQFVRFDRPAVTPTGNGDTTEERIQRIVDYYSWGGTVEAGTSTVTLDSTTHVQNAWEQLNRTVDDELGMIYITAQGNVRWTGRAVWFTLTPPVLTLGCGDPTFYDVLVDASPSNLDIQMKNTVYAARTGGSTQTASNTTSIDQYGPYEYKRTDLGLADNTQVGEWANTVVELYAFPQIVLADVAMHPALHDESWNSWSDVLGIKAVTDLVRVVWAPPDHPAHVVDTIVRVVGYKHTVSRSAWEIEWQLVDAQALRFAGSIWTLGEHANDQLDAGFVLGFTSTGGS